MIKEFIKSLFETIMDSSKENTDAHISVTQNAVGKDINITQGAKTTQIGQQINYYYGDTTSSNVSDIARKVVKEELDDRIAKPEEVQEMLDEVFNNK